MRWQQRLLAIALLAFCSTAFAENSPPAEPDTYRADNYRSPVPETLKGGRVLTTDEAETIWRGGSAAFIDVAAASATSEPATRHSLARDAAAQYSRKHLVTRYGLRRTCCQYRRLFAAWSQTGVRRRSRQASGVLLSGELLDVVECGEAGVVLRIFQRRLVSRWHRWLGGGRPARRGIATGAPAFGVRELRIAGTVSYSISCWIVRPSANRRWSIVTGTSHAKRTTLLRSSKMRVCQVSSLASCSILV